MKQINKLVLLALASTAILTSCSSDDDNNGTPNVPKGTYDNGYFILNEGNSNPATASIAFVDQEGALSQDIFRTENPDAPETGSYLQSMFFSDTHAFIISGQANQVTVVDRYTFEYITTIASDLASPRYGAVANGKAYVTNSNGWEAGGSDDFVTVINLTDYSTSTFPMENAEGVTEEDGIVYFSNGYYGSGHSITALNSNNNETEVIDLGEGNSPNSLEEEDGYLYVLTQNFEDTPKIFKIDLASNSISMQITLPEDLSAAKQLNVEDDIIYFTNNTSVFKVNTSGDEDSFDKVLEYTSNSEYGAMYGFAVEDDKIYIADGGDFASNAPTYEYNLSGTQLTSYSPGIGPNSFYFND